MTVDDCANLLIGSISGYRANKCYSAIGDAKVIFFNPEHDNHFIEDDPISEPFLTGDLGQLYQAGSFYDHLRIIIASSYDGTLSAYFDTLEKMNRIPNISINVNRRGAEMSAGIYVNSFDSIGDNRLGTGYTHHSSEYHAGDGAVRKWLNGGGPDGNGITRDLGITQTISEFTIIHLGKVLRNEIEFKRAEKV